MRLIIAGNRDLLNYKTFKEALERRLEGVLPVLVISGGAKGVDAMAERWAKEMGIEFHEEKAEWSKYQKGAGPIRNRKMATMGDTLFAYWHGGGSGTKDMIKVAQKAKLHIINQPVMQIYLCKGKSIAWLQFEKEREWKPRLIEATSGEEAIDIARGMTDMPLDMAAGMAPFITEHMLLRMPFKWPEWHETNLFSNEE